MGRFFPVDDRTKATSILAAAVILINEFTILTTSLVAAFFFYMESHPWDKTSVNLGEYDHVAMSNLVGLAGEGLASLAEEAGRY